MRVLFPLKVKAFSHKQAFRRPSNQNLLQIKNILFMTIKQIVLTTLTLSACVIIMFNAKLLKTVYKTFKQFCLKEQYKLLYLALMEAFSGPSRCVTTEKFVGAYQEQTCYANCGDAVQISSQSSEFEVILNRSTDKISNKLSLSNNASFGVINILLTTESHNFF